jgi:hypothetical protein
MTSTTTTTTTTTTSCYKDEVLGQRCWITFEVVEKKSHHPNGGTKRDGGGGSSAASTAPRLVPFAGTITAYKAELLQLRRGKRNHNNNNNNNKRISIDRQQYILFDADGEELWFNLEVEEAQGRLS